MNTRIERKHYILGALIISLAFIIQPFSLLATQNFLAPILAKAITGKNADGSVSMEGKEVPSEGLKIRGNSNAQIILVEFSDYQCPFCARFHNTPKELMNKYGDKVSWAWKHFPLNAIHPEATPSAVAAECVNKISGTEKFWDYSDTLINNQQNLNKNFYVNEAVKMGINASDFNKCLLDPSMKAIVDADLKLGETLGTSGTPNTLIVKNENGKLTVLEAVSGAMPASTFENIIDSYLD
jgi:protein-disulfide isomerase